MACSFDFHPPHSLHSLHSNQGAMCFDFGGTKWSARKRPKEEAMKKRILQTIYQKVESELTTRIKQRAARRRGSARSKKNIGRKHSGGEEVIVNRASLESSFHESKWNIWFPANAAHTHTSRCRRTLHRCTHSRDEFRIPLTGSLLGPRHILQRSSVSYPNIISSRGLRSPVPM